MRAQRTVGKLNRCRSENARRRWRKRTSVGLWASRSVGRSVERAGGLALPCSPRPLINFPLAEARRCWSRLLCDNTGHYCVQFCCASHLFCFMQLVVSDARQSPFQAFRHNNNINSRSMSLNEAVCPCLTSQFEKLNTDRQPHLRTSTENCQSVCSAAFHGLDYLHCVISWKSV